MRAIFKMMCNMHILLLNFSSFFIEKKLALGILVFKNYMGRKCMSKGEEEYSRRGLLMRCG